jgi:replicative DNA helicase
MTLPSDQALEGVVLGIAMTCPDSSIGILTDLDESDLHVQSHRVIFGAIRSLSERGAVTDSTAVVAELKATGQLERLGGVQGDAVPYIRGLAMAAPEAANLADYVCQLKSLSLRRGIIDASSEALRRAGDMSTCAEELVDQLAIGFSDLAVHKKTTEPASMRELALAEIKDLDRRREIKNVIGVPTGYPDLDAIIGGLEKQTLTLLAGRPGMGKSALGGSLVVNIAKAGTPVLIFSLEMSSTSMFRRMVAAEGRVSARNLRTGKLTEAEYPRVTRALGDLSSLPIHIDPDSSVSEVDIRARSRRHKGKHGLGLVLVDHVQLVRSDRREHTRDLEISNVSWGLKKLAKELDVPVVALCQLSREVEKRPIKARKPILSDLRDSGTLEQNSDVVIGLYREGYYLPNSERATELDLGVIKNREGDTGETVLNWNKNSVRFDSIERMRHEKLV